MAREPVAVKCLSPKEKKRLEQKFNTMLDKIRVEITAEAVDRYGAALVARAVKYLNAWTASHPRPVSYAKVHRLFMSEAKNSRSARISLELFEALSRQLERGTGVPRKKMLLRGI